MLSFGVKKFCPVWNKQNVIDKIDKTNLRNKAISVSTFDLSSKCADIPHHKLKSVMRGLINFCFNGGLKEFFAITECGAICTNNQQKSIVILLCVACVFVN